MHQQRRRGHRSERSGAASPNTGPKPSPELAPGPRPAMPGPLRRPAPPLLSWLTAIPLKNRSQRAGARAAADTHARGCPRWRTDAPPARTEARPRPYVPTALRGLGVSPPLPPPRSLRPRPQRRRGLETRPAARAAGARTLGASSSAGRNAHTACARGRRNLLSPDLQPWAGSRAAPGGPRTLRRRNCAKAADELPNSCRRAAPGAESGQDWPKCSKSWSKLTNIRCRSGIFVESGADLGRSPGLPLVTEA